MKKFLFNFCFSIVFILSCFAANGMMQNQSHMSCNFSVEEVVKRSLSEIVVNGHVKCCGKSEMRCVYCGHILKSYLCVLSHLINVHNAKLENRIFSHKNVSGLKNVSNNTFVCVLQNMEIERMKIKLRIILKQIEAIEKPRRRKRRREFNQDSGRDLLHEDDIDFEQPISKKRKIE